MTEQASADSRPLLDRPFFRASIGRRRSFHMPASSTVKLLKYKRKSHPPDGLYKCLVSARRRPCCAQPACFARHDLRQIVRTVGPPAAKVLLSRIKSDRRSAFYRNHRTDRCPVGSAIEGTVHIAPRCDQQGTAGGASGCRTQTAAAGQFRFSFSPPPDIPAPVGKLTLISDYTGKRPVSRAGFTQICLSRPALPFAGIRFKQTGQTL